MRKRRDLLKLAGLTPFAMLPAAAAALPNGIRTIANAKVTKEPFGELAVYYDGSTGQLKSMVAGSLRLHPGAMPHPPHQHPEEEFLLVTEGTGEINVDGKITRVGPGSMQYSASNVLHGIVNTGKTPLLFYWYKWQK